MFIAAAVAEGLHLSAVAWAALHCLLMEGREAPHLHPEAEPEVALLLPQAGQAAGPRLVEMEALLGLLLAVLGAARFLEAPDPPGATADWEWGKSLLSEKA